MRYLRKNTAVIVSVGPFYDKTDGVTIENALTITNEKITLVADTDDGNAPTLILDNVTGATSGTDNDLNYITNCDAGLMQLELTAANTNRVGRLLLTITDAANHVPVFHEFMVLDAAVYDSLVAGTDKLAADAQEISATAVDAILDEVVEGSLTMRQMLRVLMAVLAGKAAGGGTSTITFRDQADSKNRILATVDGAGNRTAITLDAS